MFGSIAYTADNSAAEEKTNGVTSTHTNGQPYTEKPNDEKRLTAVSTTRSKMMYQTAISLRTY